MKSRCPRLLPDIGIALAVGLSAKVNGFAQQISDDLLISQSPNRVLTTLRVLDSEPVPVVFDTGTSGNIIDRGLAERFGFRRLGPSTANDGTLGKPVPGFLTEVKGAVLGGISISDGRANAIAYDHPDEKGIFGPNCFPGKLVRMDLSRESILVESKTPSNLPHSVAIPYIGKGDDALPSVTVDFGTMRVAAELDTGNNEELILPLSFANRLSLESPPNKIGEEISAAGKQPLFRARLKGSLKVGPLRLDRPDILFIEGGQANVGLPIARQLVIIFDPSEKRSWLISQGAISRPKWISIMPVVVLTLVAIPIVARLRRKDASRRAR